MGRAEDAGYGDDPVPRLDAASEHGACGVTWTPFDDEMRDAMLGAATGPVHYDGDEVAAFEAEMAAYLGVGHAVAASSGTCALHLALLALGIGPGDEVVVPANAYVALPESILHVGARPVYCDVDEATANLDPTLLPHHLGARTRAVIVVHMYGNPAEMDAVAAACRPRGVHVVEDVAHALGGSYGGAKLGALGAVGFTSFARKVIHVAGQGGMAFTDDAERAERMRRLRKHGWDPGDPERRDVAAVGFNFSFSECLAAVGRVNLRRIEAYRRHRDRHARRYLAAIRRHRLPLRTFATPPEGEHGRLHFVVRTPHRDALARHLARHGVASKVHYRVPAYRHAVYRAATGDRTSRYPVADRLANEVLTLPSHPDAGAALEPAIDALRSFFHEPTRPGGHGHAP